MIKNRGIAFRLAAPVLAGTVLTFLVVFAAGYLHSREMILAGVEKNARNLALRIAYRIESVLAPVEKLPDDLAVVLERMDMDESALAGVLRGMFATHPDLFGAGVAFAPYAFEPDALYYFPYLSRQGTAAELAYLGGEHYHYFYKDWYQIPRETLTPCWSEPYFDEGGGDILMATYARPFFCEDVSGRRFSGVITADISLAWLEKTISAIPVLRTGYGFILSRNGAFITHPEKN
jgi:phosphoserine phosphatase RsbU/P